MDKTMKTIIGAGCGLLLAFATFTPPAAGREALREGFENVGENVGESPAGKEGSGLTRTGPEGSVRAPEVHALTLDLGAAATGAISFDLQRKAAPAERRQTIFIFHDRKGDSLFRMQVDWGKGEEPSQIAFPGRFYWEETLGVRPAVDIPQAVAPGQWIHVDLTWSGKSLGLFVDGTRISLAYPDDPRYALNERLRKLLKQPEKFRFTLFGEMLGRAKSVTFGISAAPGDDVGKSPLVSAVLDNFALFVDEIPAPGGDALGLSIATVDHDAARTAGFSDKLVTGDVVTVSLGGSPGAEAAFDVARLADRRGEIALSWKGWGVYLEEITFFEEDQIDLRDVEEYRVYASREPIDVAAVTPETPFIEALDVEEQSYTLEKVTVPVEGGEDFNEEFLEADTPYYVVVAALMDDETFRPIIEPKQGLAMVELEGDPGTYEGTFTVDLGDVYPEAVVVARLARGEASIGAVADETFEIDARLNLEVASSEEELKADEKSTSEITVTVTDANGDAVEDHEVRFFLATTSQYTGVVGGGAFSREVGGALDVDFRGETDMFGRVTATYTAGFAAKTAIVVARDMVSNDTGAGYVKTYINATAQLELEAVQETAGKALGYAIAVTSSDEWLTADGRSEARITALVTHDGVPVEGHRVGFTVSAGSGRIRTTRGETDANGKARAVYTAGTKIGAVLIRATDHSVPGLTGTVQIELRSDAPAKIGVTVTPEVLPADGRSTADVAVAVTDINDNPNEGIEVEYVVTIGSGRIRDVDPVTDRRGESAAEYVAGRIPGKVSIAVTVRSAVPTEEELLAARDLAVTVTDYDFY